MDGSAPLASVRPPATLHEVRLNGFPEGLAGVRRHRFGGCVRQVAGAARTGVLDARFVVQPGRGRSPHGRAGRPFRCSASLLLGATLRESPAEAGGGLRPL